MTSSAERFLAAVTRWLKGSAEDELAARQQLRAGLEDPPQPSTEALDEAAVRLERLDPRRHGKGWGILVLALALLASLAGFATLAGPAGLLWRKARASMSGQDIHMEEEMSRHLPAEQKRLLVGDLSKGMDPMYRIGGLWESEPDNPAFFADFVRADIWRRRQPPADMLRVAGEIDPDNGWFHYIAAMQAADRAVDFNAPRHVLPDGTKTVPIRDEVALAEMIDQLRIAGAKQRFTAYYGQLLAQRIPLIPARDTWFDATFATVFLDAEDREPLGAIQMGPAISAAAMRLAEEGRVQEFQDLYGIWRRFMIAFLSDDNLSRWNQRMARLLAGSSKAFVAGAAMLALPAESVQSAQALHTSGGGYFPGKDEVAMHGSMLQAELAGRLHPAMNLAEAPAKEDLRAGRLAEHAFFSKIASLAGWLVLAGATAAAALYRFRGSRLSRQLAEPFAALLRRRDWLWILGGGLLLPGLYHQALVRLTDVGARDWSLQANRACVAGGQWVVLVLLLLATPVVFARWRLGKRAGELGLGRSGSVVLATGIVSGAGAFVWFGSYPHIGPDLDPTHLVALSLAGFLPLALAVGACQALVSSSHKLLGRLTMARILTVVYSIGMALMGISMVAHHVEERQWIARDRLSKPSIDPPAISRLEAEVHLVARKELLRLLDEGR